MADAAKRKTPDPKADEAPSPKTAATRTAATSAAATPTAATSADGPLAAALRGNGSARGLSASIMGIELAVRFSLGSTRLDVATLMDLCDGQVLRMDRAEGDPVEVIVDGTVIAEGALIDDENGMGVRITNIRGADADDA